MFSDYSKKNIQKKLNKFVEKGIFSNKGLGKVNETLGKCAQIYEAVKALGTTEKTKDDMIARAKTIYEKSSACILDDTTITDKAVSEAYANLDKKRLNLQKKALAYLGNVTTDEEEDEEEEESWWDRHFGWLIKCPVDVMVYNKDGDIVGYISDGEVYYEDEIKIETDGDIKKVYVPEANEYDIKIIGTDYGLLNCSFEEYEGGDPVGRTNFYNIELYEGKEFEVSDDIQSIEDEYNSVTLISGGDTYSADDYFAVTDNAAVEISVSSTENGLVTGTGIYAKGDGVRLTVHPDSGYVFKGWYADGELVCSTTTYDFCATESVELTAALQEYKNSISVSQDMPYEITLDSYEEVSGTIAVALCDEEDKLIEMKIYSAAETVTTDLEKVDSAAYIKFMWWDDLSTLKPLSDACVIELE